jgi:hypothetical protein
MSRRLALACRVPIFAALLLVSPPSAVADSRASCEEACIQREDACYERCDRSDEPEDCALECQSTADACLEHCEE